jgi:ribosomal protein S27E
MSVQLACNAKMAVTQDLSRPNFSRPKCPRCGNVLLIAEESAFNLKGRIRHAWSCDDCAHEFVTSITLWPRKA